MPAVYIAVLLSLLVPAPVAAQPTGYQEYYVLGYEEHVWRAFVDIYDGPDGDIRSRICSTVSMVATTNRQVIYYDHWEDGYEPVLLNPVQPTTEVHGDGDPSNGGTESDILLAGDEVNLTSDQDNNTVNGYVPVNHRDPNQIRYDGGDRLLSSSGPVNLTHAMWPLNTSWVGGAWEVYSRQAYADTYAYHLPVGEDLYTFGGGDYGTYGDFRNVYLQLEAFEDDTTVSIDNGTDAVNVALDRGQTYSSIGYTDSAPAPSITIDSGTAIRSNRPVQVGLITGAESPQNAFQGRFLIILPDVLWGADYVVPVPSGGSGSEAEVYLFNPNDFPITIHAHDRETQTAFVVSPTAHISATVPYSQERGGYVPADSAARFTSSDGIFGIVVCADSSHRAYAWGFSAIPSQYLTRDYYVSWAPGSSNIPPTENGSPVWVTPLADGTTFYVDYSPLDGIVDEQFTLDVLEQRRIFDPDNDNTGMHVWATSAFSIIWGEDPRTADLRNPYLDLGITILPLPQHWLDPEMTLDKTAEPTILPPAGGAVTFTLAAQAHDAPLVNVAITDTLPIRWTYVPGTTQVIFPDGSTGDPEPRIDDRTLFWDLSANLGLDQSVILTFQARISDTAGVTISTNRGEAVGKHQPTGVVFNPSDEANVYISPLNLVKSVSSAQARAGDTLVYTLSYGNPSSNTVTNVVLRDVVPIQYVTFQSASNGGTYNPANGTVNWALGTLAPGASGSVTFTVRVNDFARDGTIIENVGYINSAQTAEAGSNAVRTTVLAPQVKFTKSGPTAAAQGQAITYTLSYDNVGGTRATGVTIQDTIPVSTTYETGSLAINTGSGWVPLTDDDDGDQGAYIPPALTIAPGATAGTIAVGEAGQIRFSVRLDDDVSPGSFVQNWATLGRDLGIPRASNLVVTRISDSAIIHGTVFEDTNGDGTRDAGEPGIRQVLITLDGVITTTTDLDGSYTFSTTVPGVHTVVETDPIYSPTVFDESSVKPGDMVRALESGPVTAGKLDLPGYFSTTPNEVHVDVILGQGHRVDFGDMLTDSGFASIYGTVFNDADGDGVRDVDESGIPGVRITLDGVTTTTSDINGCYTFSTTATGTHTVVETDRAGYFSTTPNEVHVDVMLGHGYQVEFGDAPISSDLAAIYGTVFEDLDRDGAWDPDELGIPDVLITMDWIITTTTDFNGGYTFSTTMAGTHTLRETDPDDHVSTTANTVHQDVRLGEGFQVDFGDVRLDDNSCDADIYEEDDTVLQAATFLVGTSQAHQFCDDATDWVKFTAWAGNVYTITTSSWGRRADTYLALFDRDGQRLLAANDDYEATSDYSSRIVWQVPVDGLYYVRTTNQGALTGYRTDYDLLIEGLKPSTVIYLPIVMRNQDSAGGTDVPSADSLSQDTGSRTVLYPTGVISHTCPDGYEPDDTWHQLTSATIRAGIEQIHSFDSDPQEYAADKDFVRFDVSTGRAVIFRIAPVTNTQTLMELYDERGASLFVTGTTRLMWIPDTSGSYYLSVRPQGDITSFGCADTAGYNLLMETPEASFIYLPVVTRYP